jgi:hypothetical protein
MRITRRPSIPGIAPLDDPASIAPPPGFTPPGARGRDADPSAGDRVELSEAARLRPRLRADLGSVEETDASQVATLRARIAADAYHPTADAVARSLVGELAADLVV